MKVAVLLLASGRGERLGASIPKAWVPIAGEPIVMWSLRRLLELGLPGEIVLALQPGDRATHAAPWLERMRSLGLGKVVDGGATRTDSMRRAFEASAPDCEVVLVHDAARPFFPLAATHAAIARARELGGGALLAVPISDTIKRVHGDATEPLVHSTVDRRELWAAQTPQVVMRTALQRALAHAADAGFAGATDDVSLLEHAGIAVAVVRGSPRNIKITTPADLELAEFFARQPQPETDLK